MLDLIFCNAFKSNLVIEQKQNLRISIPKNDAIYRSSLFFKKMHYILYQLIDVVLIKRYTVRVFVLQLSLICSSCSIDMMPVKYCYC